MQREHFYKNIALRISPILMALPLFQTRNRFCKSRENRSAFPLSDGGWLRRKENQGGFLLGVGNGGRYRTSLPKNRSGSGEVISAGTFLLISPPPYWSQDKHKTSNQVPAPILVKWYLWYLFRVWRGFSRYIFIEDAKTSTKLFLLVIITSTGKNI